MFDRCAAGARGNDDRRDRKFVARLVEVLEIKRVVANLIEREAGELLLADLELQHEEHRADQCQHVDPLAQARNGVFEVQRSRVAVRRECGLQNVDLFQPSVRLSRFQTGAGSAGAASELPENLVGRPCRGTRRSYRSSTRGSSRRSCCSALQTDHSNIPVQVQRASISGHVTPLARRLRPAGSGPPRLETMCWTSATPGGRSIGRDSPLKLSCFREHFAKAEAGPMKPDARRRRSGRR